MSKDKAGKKDKLKRLDLFEMMLNQSQVFRDMVEQFQSAWVPRASSVVIESGMAPNVLVEKQAKAAPAAKPAKKRTARKSVASTKPAPTAVKRSPPKSPSKAKAASSQPKRVTPSKTAAKAAAGRVAKKK